MEVTIRPEVYAGAAWLDERRPGWEFEINLGRLNMRNDCNCIVGQLYGNYFGKFACAFQDGGPVQQYIAYLLGGTMTAARAVKLGFNLPVELMPSGQIPSGLYEALTLEWMELIMNRRAIHEAETAVAERELVEA